jgi:hypothetical protein
VTLIILSSIKTQAFNNKKFTMKYFFSIILLSYLITSCSLASVSPNNNIPTSHSGITAPEIPKEARYLSGYDYPAIPLDELGK